MTRIKRYNNSKKHKKIKLLAKGYIGRRKNVFKISKQAVIKALTYSYRDRKLKKRNFRSIWIMSINYFLKTYGFKYSFFINCLKKYFFYLNKKMLFYLTFDVANFIKLINILFFYYYYYF